MPVFCRVSLGDDVAKAAARYVFSLPDADKSEAILPTGPICVAAREAYAELVGPSSGTALPIFRPMEDALELYGASAEDGRASVLSAGATQAFLTSVIARSGMGEPSARRQATAAFDAVRTVEERYGGVAPLARAARRSAEESHGFAALFSSWNALFEHNGYESAAACKRRRLRHWRRRWASFPPERSVVFLPSLFTDYATRRIAFIVASLPGGHVLLPASTEEKGEDSSVAGYAAALIKPLYAGFPNAVKTSVPPANAERALFCEKWTANTDAFAAAVRDPLSVAARAHIGMRVYSNLSREAQATAIALAEAASQGKSAALATPDPALASATGTLLDAWRISYRSYYRASEELTQVKNFLGELFSLARDESTPSGTLHLLASPCAAFGNTPEEGEAYASRVERAVTAGYGIRKNISSPARLLAATEGLDTPVAAALAAFSRACEVFAATLREGKSFAQRRATLFPALSPLMRNRALAQKITAPFSVLASGALSGLTLHLSDVEAIIVEEAERSLRAAELPSPGAVSIAPPTQLKYLPFDLMILGGASAEMWERAPSEGALSHFSTLPPLLAPGFDVGRTAHDVAALSSAKALFVSYAEKRFAASQLPSRWTQRLAMTIQAAQGEGFDDGQSWQDDADALFAAPIRKNASVPLSPCPPLESRPKIIHATELETLAKNPYDYYARHILRLRRLYDAESEGEAGDYGSAFHKAADKYAKTAPQKRDADLFLRYAEEEIARALGDKPAFLLRELWRARLVGAARAAAEREDACAREGIVTETEKIAQKKFGEVTLKARLDRLERSPDGTLSVVDLKTGGKPVLRDMINGVAPQLMAQLMCALEEEAVVPPKMRIATWKPKKDGTSEEASLDVSPDIVSLALEGTERTLRRFLCEDAPFPYSPTDDGRAEYRHLSRYEEWKNNVGI
ncbi:MAG: PD-(D/E)XK nuclease family protein [Rickettsiales bacterium]